MAKYIVLFSFTDQGIREIKQSPDRVRSAKETFKKMGVEVQGFFLVLGRYDTIFMVEAPDDESVARACLAEASKGNVHTETLRIFSEDEFHRIVDALP
jgi:uncharacterized protein with GYD domain